MGRSRSRCASRDSSGLGRSPPLAIPGLPGIPQACGGGERRPIRQENPQFARATSTRLSENDGAWPMSVKADEEMLLTVPSLSWRQ